MEMLNNVVGWLNGIVWGPAIFGRASPVMGGNMPAATSCSAGDR